MNRRPRQPLVRAVVLAAGHGTRLTGGGTPKQYLRLGGQPLLTYALEVLQRLPLIESIVLVVPPGDEPLARTLVAQYAKVRRIVAGGETRCESAVAGVGALDPCDVVILQNAASPFTPAPLIAGCARAALDTGAAVGAAKSPYTSVEVKGGLITAIHNRAATWSLRDPQAFGYAALRAVHERARAEGLLREAIDEAHLFSRFGTRVALVEGPEQNFKITVATDFERAQAVLRARSTPRLERLSIRARAV